MSRDPDGGLEDLFGGVAEQPAPAEEAPAAEQKPRSRVGWVLRNLLLVAVATAVTVAVLRSQGIKVSVLLVVAAFVALRLLMLAVSEVAPPPLPRPQNRRGEESGDYRWAGNDTLRVAVRRWEQQLDWSREDGERFSRIVQPALAELADERLRLRHGITRASDPPRARELLGEPLWQMLNEPGRRPPKTRELSAYVDALEKI
ncbi:hypothetical protein Asp14428_36640 [Actinoplanes sp. NBRC 14428]|uniref:Uncharacterized protein n=1 Tax=Pseudosporangium ferrugineum TaxID=439699 RepID=A0A2T0S3Q7_9ACTN|nr:hypothetical protein [Pseudosporangium ferrugineum]PRY28064.1 hypothetical protein CLV70_109221 [Pseudosporangium ferrugineum]BCJ52189.1 hypothetical protein Asp14428_36640 [Actinoplanes sp. NBRC 14428]